MAGKWFGLLIAGGLLVAACSTGGPGNSATPASSPPPATSGGTVTIDTTSGSLGIYLVGDKAIYVFLPDGMNASTCSGQCAVNWPPVMVGPGQTPVAGSGVTAQLATITRADGSLQVAANGRPLYYFAGDTTATDTKGQGVGGNWFLAAPDGSPLGASASPGATTTGSPAPTDDGDDYY